MVRMEPASAMTIKKNLEQGTCMNKMGFTATLVAALFAASGVQASTIDLTAAGSTTTVNGAVFSGAGANTGAGSGAIQAFLRTQGKDLERGFNTTGPLLLDQVGGCCTTSLTLGQLSAVEWNGSTWFELQLDINEPNGGDKSRITLRELELWVNTSTGSDSNYADGLGTKIWSLDGTMLDLNGVGGSGNFDYRVMFPASLLAGYSSDDFLYLYNVFGKVGNSGYASEGGFEEWAARTGGTSVMDPTVVPLPPSVWLLGSSLLALALVGRRNRASGPSTANA